MGIAEFIFNVLNKHARQVVQMDNETLRQQLAAAQEGDVEAFAMVFEAYRPLVYTVAYRVAGPNDADDVVMETYLKAWRAFPNFKGNSSVKTWLYRICHNCALDFIRSRQRRPEQMLPQNEHDDRTMSDLEDTNATAPNTLLELRETRDTLQQAIDLLDPPHRTTVLLRFTDEMSYSDIAAATGVSIGTVMSRLFNAKRKLKQILKTLP